MKRLLLPALLLVAAPAARAQLLPIPGTRNPNWTLEKSETRPCAEPLDLLPTGVGRMPNAAQKSISSAGNRHSWWDGTRQLGYEWLSRLDAGTMAPDKFVVVREERTGIIYTYRRR